MSIRGVSNFFRFSLLLLLTFLVYFGAAKLGLEIATINKHASPVWPATGIAMSALYLFGYRVTAAIFLGAFFSNYQVGLPLLPSLGIAVGNTLEALAFYFASVKLGSRDSVYGVHEKSILGILAFMLSASISASIGTWTLWLNSITQGSEIYDTWMTWWVGDFLGALFIVPIAYKLKLFQTQSVKSPSFGNLLKFILCFAFCLFLLHFVFSKNQGAFLFVVFFSILLAANLLDSIWVYLISITICIYATAATIAGEGPFAGQFLNNSLLHLQIFLAGLSLTSIGIGSLKQEGLHYRSNLALIFGWVLSGVTFYILYTSMINEEEVAFDAQSAKVVNSIVERMEDYETMLASGVSYFDSSDHVSETEWQVFASNLMSTNTFAGIQGFGVIFSQANQHTYRLPKVHKNLAEPSDPQANKSAKDKYIITYIEPFPPNRLAVGLNISSESKRYEAAARARDTGEISITEEIKLVQDKQGRSGSLIFAPLYKKNFPKESVQERRKALIGFIYAPLIYEDFMNSATSQYASQFLLRLSLAQESNPHHLFVQKNWSDSNLEINKKRITLAGKEYVLDIKRADSYGSSVGLVSSWIGFFGAIISLFLAVMLSSLEEVKIRAQNLAEKMTKELNERKRTWEALTETSPVGIYLTDISGRYTYVNPRWQAMTGLSLSDVQAHGWEQAIHPEDLPIVCEAWNQLVDGGVFSCDYRLIQPDQNYAYVIGQAKALRDESNNLTGYFGTLQDVTELHNNQVALMTSSKLSSLGQMASGIAHEINNPLAIIQGKSTTIQKILQAELPIDREALLNHLSKINLTVHRIAKIIRGLQSFARDGSNDAFEKTSLNKVLEDTLELCREKFYNHDIQLQILPDEIPAIYFLGRPEQISQVLLNLLNNAHDAVMNSVEKWVRLECEIQDEDFYIRVSDSGPGVPAHFQARIFDPFFTTKKVGSGTGLGLSISKGIMDQHQGQIYLDSKKTHTTFVIKLKMILSPSANNSIT